MLDGGRAWQREPVMAAQLLASAKRGLLPKAGCSWQHGLYEYAGGHQNDGTFAVAAMKRVSPIRT
jgi:hypothetical protein